MTIRLNEAEFRRLSHPSLSTRLGSAICKDNDQNSLYEQGLQTIRDIQALLKISLSPSPIELDIAVHNRRNQDLDNIIKGILDGLQGTSFKNDVQVSRIVCYDHPNR